MGNIVRRTEPPTATGRVTIPIEEEVQREGDGLTVSTQLHLGAQPQLLIGWHTDADRWRGGYRLLGFRSASGFAPELKPLELSKHGDLVVEESADGRRVEQLPEGTYYYTLLLCRERLFRCLRDVTIPVRFSIHVPSLKTALARVQDQLKLHELQGDVDAVPLEAEIKRNERELRLEDSRRRLAGVREVKVAEDPVEAAVRREVEPIIRASLVMARKEVALEVHLATLDATLRAYPGWEKIEPKRRAEILKGVAENLQDLIGESKLKP